MPDCQLDDIFIWSPDNMSVVDAMVASSSVYCCISINRSCPSCFTNRIDSYCVLSCTFNIRLCLRSTFVTKIYLMMYAWCFYLTTEQYGSFLPLSQDPISTPMIVIEDKERKKDALHLFKLVQKFMGDSKEEVYCRQNSPSTLQYLCWLQHAKLSWLVGF